jgi:pimeloyl-ACP methyl ester carboxylesterase
MTKPTRHFHEDIAFDYLPPTGTDSRRWVILCDGLPGAPERHELMGAIAAAGWHVVHPRYAGTWESDGQFLAHSPADDIVKILAAAKAGILTAKDQPPAREVALLGSSFGGAVALRLADFAPVDRVVALSPVISFRALAKHLATLPAYLRDTYPGTYRFDDADWERLVRDEIIDLAEVGSAGVTKTAIIAGADDEQIPVKDILDYSLAGHAAYYLALPGRGHLGFSKIAGEVLDCVLACLDSAEAANEWTARNAAALFGEGVVNMDIPFDGMDGPEPPERHRLRPRKH